MAERSSGSPFAMALCEAVGIDPQYVTSITVTCAVGDIIRATVDLIPSPSRKEEILKRIKELKEHDEAHVTFNFEMAMFDVTSLKSAAKELETIRAQARAD